MRRARHSPDPAAVPQAPCGGWRPPGALSCVCVCVGERWRGRVGGMKGGREGGREGRERGKKERTFLSLCQHDH